MPLTFQQQVVAATSTSTDEVAEVDVDDSDLETTGAVLVDFDWTGKDGKKDGEAKYPPMWYNQPFLEETAGRSSGRIWIASES